MPRLSIKKPLESIATNAEQKLAASQSSKDSAKGL